MRYLVTGPMVVLALLLVAACGGGAEKPDGSGTVVIELTESAFTLNNIEVMAGTTVRFVLENTGQEEYEFMIGRVVSRAPGYPDTFETDFFHGVKVDVAGDPVMVMGGEAVLTRDGMAQEDDHDEESSGMEGMAMDDDHGFMISQAAATGGTVVTIEIPADKAGTWEIGCFVDEGTHYEDGMKGTLTVISP